MKNPKTLAGPDIKATNVSFHVAFAFRIGAGLMRSTDNDDIACDDRCRLKPDLAAEQIDVLVVVEFEIDNTVLAEGSDRHAGLRVQRNETISGSYIKDAF